MVWKDGRQTDLMVWKDGWKTARDNNRLSSAFVLGKLIHVYPFYYLLNCTKNSMAPFAQSYLFEYLDEI